MKLKTMYVILFIIGISANLYGADSKTTALPENTTPLSTDLLYMVDDPGGTAASQKITFANALKDLATPTTLVGTNISGTASGLTAGAVTNATLTTAITVDTGTVGLTGDAANTSVLTLPAGALSITNIDNTSDADKPVSAATQTALDAKATT